MSKTISKFPKNTKRTDDLDDYGNHINRPKEYSQFKKYPINKFEELLDWDEIDDENLIL